MTRPETVIVACRGCCRTRPVRASRRPTVDKPCRRCTREMVLRGIGIKGS